MVALPDMARTIPLLGSIKALFSAPESRAASGTLKDAWTALLLGSGGPTAAGVSVSPETAMRSTAVFGAVKVLAETVSQLPIHVYRQNADGGRERASDHPVEALLSDAANPWTPASEFRLIMETQLALHGNAYAWIGRGAAGVEELIPLESQRVAVEADAVTMEPSYTVTDANGHQRTYGRTEILHIRGVGAGLYKGDSPVVLAREAIALSMVLEKHGAGLFGRGARPAGILETPNFLTAEQRAALSASWNGQHQGGSNAGKTAILESGLKFVPLQLSSVDAQFLEMRKFQLQEIARVWRVPLHLLADLDRVTHSNAEELGRQFLTFTLLPILRAWQDALRLTLLTPEERRAGLYIEFLVDDLARADLSARFTSYSQAVAAGIYNPNEIRAMENRSPYAGGEVYTRPVNTAAVDKPAGGDTDA
ncbi:phage portal protein [Roseomonas marmotae]|uniref:phage portal protein n=1 Tax=Roseomonas marmotae TaxID=2768161 RepID=UPI001AD6E1A5|nr:phage portal protein [Roseomonas marmotae]QTI79016.1 phage portal protein [Roseomonas marmotae]